MNKQIAEKADLFLTGLQGRYEDGKDFFLFIQIDFSSGNKVYSLKVERTGELLSYHFMGNSYQTDFEAFRIFLKKQIPEFDEMDLNYAERGRNIYIRADQKTVVSETKDQSENPLTPPGIAVMGDREYYI